MNRRVFIYVLALMAAVRSRAAEAQPVGRPWRIGLLAQASAEGVRRFLEAFRNALKELGYTEGRHYVMDLRLAEGRAERLPALAAELTALPVDVLVANSTPAALAAMQATRVIPIVTVAVADPVGSGLVQSFARPGGNVTGTAWALDEVSHKWLELLKTTRDGLSRVGVLQNSTNRSMAAMLRPLETSARRLRVTLTLYDLTRADALAGIFNSLASDRAEGLVVLPDSFVFDQMGRINEHATRMRLPAIYGNRGYVRVGGLMSYGPDVLEDPVRAASYVDRILKGMKPADLPVERSRKFELVINMKTAKALGLAIPPALLLQAEQVLE